MSLSTWGRLLEVNEVLLGRNSHSLYSWAVLGAVTYHHDSSGPVTSVDSCTGPSFSRGSRKENRTGGTSLLERHSTVNVSVGRQSSQPQTLAGDVPISHRLFIREDGITCSQSNVPYGSFPNAWVGYRPQNNE